MENKIAVVVDSTTTLPEGYLSGLETRSAPAIIIWAGEELYAFGLMLVRNPLGLTDGR